MPDLDSLNRLPEDAARAELVRCCGSTRWAGRMSAQRPFASMAELITAADAAEAELTRDDWLEAFTAHPKIGGVDSLRTKFASTAVLSAHEQSGVHLAAEAVLQALAEGNRLYEERFGHIFIACATGKTADEMLALLQQRLHNAPDQELTTAAAEQTKITRLRLPRLCS